ncbi:sigma 54-interacting transcriptional regulator [Pendulispora brunnea]|uniref:Sigma 54-interacting transcriptional regulator n=1 Tax=Pendulispora brunnea TaxID=2905690 RepID=A0ABZ2KMP3_9BACT
MKAGPSARLVVARGPDAGTQAIIHEQVKTVGRSREAHLVLSDRSVSRHHFHVHATQGGAYVRVCDGATPLLVHDREVFEAEVGIGEPIVVGETVIVVAGTSGEAELPSIHDYHGTTINLPALLSGQATDVRGLAAVFALNSAIGGAVSVAELEAALDGWAKGQLGCDDAKILAVNRPPPSAGEVEPVPEAQADRNGTTIFVPTHGAPTGWLAFTTRVPVDQVKDSLRRLLVIAAALCSSRFAQIATLHQVQDERETYRRQAVGSARAFLGASASAEEVVRMIPRLAVSDATVLLLGETGAGKSFVARLIHESGPRKTEPFRALNCAAIPENLIESELFGHSRGAFTGAVASKAGAFEAAERGTLFLDEIGELPLASQAKLLHVLEAKQFERLGSTKSIPMQARILAATNRDLEEMIANGSFRQDLYFRISVIKTTVPSLRERGDDVILLAEQILGDFAASSGRRITGFSPEALEAIRRYPWPGNVRELRNVIEHALVLGDGPVIDVTDFPLVVARAAAVHFEAPRDARATHIELPMNEERLQEMNREAALRSSGGNKTRAAALLGIRRARLYPNKK